MGAELRKERTAELLENPMSRLVDYILTARSRELPSFVVEATCHHVLDTIAAIISGSRLAPGRKAVAYAGAQTASAQATVFGTDIVTSRALAALVNSMAAHADESDDSHGPSRTHPGCSVVPASIAIAESLRCTGQELIRAVALGYDVAARLPLAIWPDLVSAERVFSTHSFGGLFGSIAAVGMLANCGEAQVRSLLAYAAQQASGIRTYFRHNDHTEKAFVFAGKPSFQAAMTLDLVLAGWSGVQDVLDGRLTLFSIGGKPSPSALVRGLGERFEIVNTNYKKYPVGTPAQAPIEALLQLLSDEQIDSSMIQKVCVGVSSEAYAIVNDREMPNLNLEYLLHCAIEDRCVSFDASHDVSRFDAWRASGKDARVVVLKDTSQSIEDGASVCVTTSDGVSFRHVVRAVPGSSANPLTVSDLIEKARHLMEPVVGEGRSKGIVEWALGLPEIEDVGTIRDLVLLNG